LALHCFAWRFCGFHAMTPMMAVADVVMAFSYYTNDH
jgi:hypothetical protein